MDARVKPGHDGEDAMIDHVSIPVRDLGAATRFYQTVLAPIGFAKVREAPGTVGFGKKYAEFWLNVRPQIAPVDDSGAHVCLRARDAAAVDAFHAAALELGATSRGAPGIRSHYTTGYYAAFIRDADGNCVEVVTFLNA
jgi:catechol 2,3-dioxygenase-like lactoylglutathione lyase family enzyme